MDTYNELIPGPGQLSATLLIEYATPEERNVQLRALIGLESHIWLVISDTGDTEPVPARFDDRQIATDRISSVQHLKFQLSGKQIRQWSSGTKIVVDHPAYRAKQVLTPAVLEELASDFL